MLVIEPYGYVLAANDCPLQVQEQMVAGGIVFGDNDNRFVFKLNPLSKTRMSYLMSINQGGGPQQQPQQPQMGPGGQMMMGQPQLQFAGRGGFQRGAPPQSFNAPGRPSPPMMMGGGPPQQPGGGGGPPMQPGRPMMVGNPLRNPRGGPPGPGPGPGPIGGDVYTRPMLSAPPQGGATRFDPIAQQPPPSGGSPFGGPPPFGGVGSFDNGGNNNNTPPPFGGAPPFGGVAREGPPSGGRTPFGDGGAPPFGGVREGPPSGGRTPFGGADAGPPPFGGVRDGPPSGGRTPFGGPDNGPPPFGGVRDGPPSGGRSPFGGGPDNNVPPFGGVSMRSSFTGPMAGGGGGGGGPPPFGGVGGGAGGPFQQPQQSPFGGGPISPRGNGGPPPFGGVGGGTGGGRMRPRSRSVSSAEDAADNSSPFGGGAGGMGGPPPFGGSIQPMKPSKESKPMKPSKAGKPDPMALPFAGSPAAGGGQMLERSVTAAQLQQNGPIYRGPQLERASTVQAFQPGGGGMQPMPGRVNPNSSAPFGAGFSGDTRVNPNSSAPFGAGFGGDTRVNPNSSAPFGAGFSGDTRVNPNSSAPFGAGFSGDTRVNPNSSAPFGAGFNGDTSGGRVNANSSAPFGANNNAGGRPNGGGLARSLPPILPDEMGGGSMSPVVNRPAAPIPAGAAPAATRGGPPPKKPMMKGPAPAKPKAKTTRHRAESRPPASLPGEPAAGNDDDSTSGGGIAPQYGDVKRVNRLARSATQGASDAPKALTRESASARESSTNKGDDLWADFDAENAAGSDNGDGDDSGADDADAAPAITEVDNTGRASQLPPPPSSNARGNDRAARLPPPPARFQLPPPNMGRTGALVSARRDGDPGRGRGAPSRAAPGRAGGPAPFRLPPPAAARGGGADLKPLDKPPMDKPPASPKSGGETDEFADILAIATDPILDDLAPLEPTPPAAAKAAPTIKAPVRSPYGTAGAIKAVPKAAAAAPAPAAAKQDDGFWDEFDSELDTMSTNKQTPSPSGSAKKLPAPNKAAVAAAVAAAPAVVESDPSWSVICEVDGVNAACLRCLTCNESMCQQCYDAMCDPATHATAVVEAIVCDNDEELPAQVRCNDCATNYCQVCFEELHLPGSGREDHASEPIGLGLADAAGAASEFGDLMGALEGLSFNF